MGNFGKKENHLRNISTKVCGIIPMLIGMIALTGWILDIPVLSTLLSGRIPMAPSTAILFILFGIIIYYYLSSDRINNRIGILINLAGNLIALLLFFLSIIGIQSNIESFGVNIIWTIDSINAGHMSPVTAIGFMFISISILIIQISKERKLSILISFIISVLVIFSTTILTVSYILGAPLFYGLNFIPPAYTTSVAFLFIGISILLSALRVWNYDEYYDESNRRSIIKLVLIFSVFSLGIIFAGVRYYENYEKYLKKEFVNELTSITDLKAGELSQWRKERFNNGNVFYKNDLLAEHIKDYFNDKDASINKKKIETWLRKVNDVDDVETVYLLDSELMKQIVVPENNERDKLLIAQNNYDLLKSGKIVFEDFSINAATQEIYINVLVPVFDNLDSTNFIGIVLIKIDPHVYLYPLINNWPSPTETAETVIINGDGNEVVFQNGLKIRENSALKLRKPLGRNEYVVVKALKGITGIVEGLDYNDDEVIADIKPISNSPWIMVTRMEKAEVYSPMKEIFWWTIFTIVSIILIIGSIITAIWRDQRTRFYKERYNSAEVLRESESRFRLLYENSPVPYQSMDEKGNLIEVNNAFLEQLGYTYQEVIGHHITEFLVEEDIPLVQERFPKFMKSGDLHDAEFRFKHKNGNVITVSVNGKIGYDINGEFAQTHCVLHNITERKNAEDLLRESEEKFRKVFEEGPVGMAMADFETGRLFNVNNTFCKMLGYTEEELLQFTFLDVTHPDDREKDIEAVRKMREGEIQEYNLEKQYVKKNGELIWATRVLTSVSSPDGKSKYALAMIQDITERKIGEMELQESERLLKESQSIARLGSFVWDLETGIWESSKILDEIFGINEEYNRSFEGWLNLIHPEFRDFMNEYVANDILQKNLRFDKEYKIIRKSDGQEGWVHGLAELDYDKNNNPVKLLGTISDITNRKKAEEEILKLNRVYKVLSNVNQMIVRTSNTEEILKEACNIAVTDGQFKVAWVGAVNNETNKLEVYTSSGITTDNFNKISIDLNDEIISSGPSGSAIKTGEHQICNDIENDERMIPWRENAKKIGYKSSMAFPIKIFGITLYTLAIYSNEVNFFDEDEIKLLDELVMDVSFALEFVEREKDRRNAEEELIKTNYLNKSILDCAGEGIIGLDLNGYHTFVNPKATEMLGYTADELIPLHSHTTFHHSYSNGEKYPLEKCPIYETIKDAKIHFGEEYFWRKDGSGFWVEFSSIPIMENEIVTGSVVTFRDITERKQSEDALKRSEERLKMTLNVTNIGIWDWDLEKDTWLTSPTFYTMLGYDPISGFSDRSVWLERVHPEDLESVKNKIQSVLNGDNSEYKYEARMKHSDGTYRWHSVIGHAIEWDDKNKPARLIGVRMDINEKKQSEESLKASEEKYRNLIEKMPEGFYRSTPDGYFVDANPALVKLLGYDSKEEIMKVNIPETFYFSKDERDNIGNIDFVPDTEVYRLRKKDGSEIWIEDHARYIKDESGKVMFHEGIMRDITNSLHAQKAIIEAKDKAEELSRLKSSFLANMSHEIRTPLNGILGFAELLKNELKEEEHLSRVKVIEKGGRRLLETLDLILNFSKLEAEMVSAKYSSVNVGNVINEVADHFEAMAKNKNLYIKKNFKNENLVTKIDERFLRHVVNNLVKNAIVYTHIGGVTVEFGNDEKDIIIKISDTGIGIAKENFGIIFEPFRQESEGWGRNFEGTGLGLSITKRFVEMMKGNIEVDSSVGVGSTFTVRIPFVEDTEIAAPEIKVKEQVKTRGTHPVSSKGKKSILLVENDEANLQYTLAVLNRYYKTDFAIDGYGAIEKARNNTYDIILMDINLGKKIDGIMATQEIRKLKEYKDTPIVALTAFVREGDKEEFLAGGCTHYLGKPFTVKQLLGLIDGL